MARICVSKRQYWACNSINQERRSHSSALVLANRIQMCASGNFSFRFSRFSFRLSSGREKFAFSLVTRNRFCSVFLFLFRYWVRLDFPFSSFITWRSSWCWSSFRSILSQHFPSVSRRVSFFCHPRLIHVLPKLHFPIYIACGVWLILPEPLRLGKNLLEISDWLTPFFPSASYTLSLNRFSVFFCALVGPVI